MSKQIISEIANRQAFMTLLQHNTGLIIIKLGAEWCGPCKQIKHIVHAFFATSPPEVICCDIDVDQSFDLYAFLKSKKMVNGIPALLCYAKDNQTFISTDSVTGADPTALDAFFKRCNLQLQRVKMNCL
jgi:thioredoxin-like negative regulator of GroEL